MNSHSNNWINNKIRKFLVNNVDSISFGTTAEDHAVIVLENGRIVFVDRKTGKIVSTHQVL